MPKNSDQPKTNIEFELERYKYILQQIHSLNENFHKYLSLFQTLTTAILGGGIAVVVGWQNLQIKPEIAIVGIRSLEGLLVLISIFLVMSIISTILSWFDYRKEEVELLRKVSEQNTRKSPTFKNFWRWHETYLLSFLVLFVAIVLIYVEQNIVPLIH